MTLGSVSWMIDCLAWPKRKRKIPCLEPGAFSARMTMALIISSVLPDRDPPANMICVAGDASSSLASSCLAVSLNKLAPQYRQESPAINQYSCQGRTNRPNSQISCIQANAGLYQSDQTCGLD